MTLSNTESDLLLRMTKALERSAEAEEERNRLIRIEAGERREAWEKSEARQDAAVERIVAQDSFVRPVVPSAAQVVDWLRDDDRLCWAIARARDRPSGSTVEDEALGRGILAALDMLAH